ncbi:uncharacterized protein LOC105257610 [Camponotus floridanus]|uniref:uncharacterized protein LOC105257610 n=1 Tax=Camponotus floridanus TaxID=104421 RepID=UPI000DC6814C|nr:uncharacterized protein LOC105257610 [Camponotus floridanus]
MEHNEEGKKFSAAVGFGSHSDRHGEGVDPALPGSSSVEGPTASLPAGLAENVASADDITKRRLRSCTSRTSIGDDDLAMDLESSSTKIFRDDDGSDDDARSCASPASNISSATSRSVDRKRKNDDRDYCTSAGKKKQLEDGSSTEAHGFKEPAKSFSTRGKNLGKFPNKTQKTEVELQGMTIAELKSSALEWIDHVEQIRKSSGNLQGRLSGIIKDRLISLGDIVNCLAEKAEERGDPIYHKMQSKELNAKIKCLEKEEAKWKIEKNRYEDEILALTKKNEEIEAKLWAADRNLDVTNKTMSKKTLEDLDKEWPALRPPLQGVRKVLSSTNPLIQAPPPVSSVNPHKSSEDIEIDSITKEIKKLMMKKKQMIKEKGKKCTDREQETETEDENRPQRKGKPRIISNIQIAPPRPSKRTRKKDTKAKDRGDLQSGNKGFKGTPPKDKSSSSRNDRSQTRTKKVPKTAAVTITVKEGISYAEILRQAREKISLPTIGIDASKIRKGINGGIIIEISGEGNTTKATNLANKLKEILPDRDNVRISQPTAMADIKISDLDDSVTKQEIVEIIADLDKCNPDTIKAGDIRWMPNGLGTIWLRCPASTANNVAASGKIKVGWTVAKIEILPARPLQCYRCWNFGHVRYSCTSTVDRSSHCYRCGSSTHRISNCTAPNPHCIICEEKGNKANHRLGSAACSAINNASKNRSLPRISREELEARNKRNIYNREDRREENIYNRKEEDIYNSNDPDRRTEMDQYMVEHEIAIAVISEPIHIPTDNCASSSDQKAAIIWKSNLLRAQCRAISSGEGFVAIMYGQTVSGDFNAKSTAWGSTYTCSKGRILENWAIANEIILMNKGNAPTCIRQQGSSVIDITWTNSRAVDLIHDWRVNENAMTYSDHNYIEYSLGDKRINKELLNRQTTNRLRYPRWSSKDFDPDMLVETVEHYCKEYISNNNPNSTSIDPDESATWIKKIMTDASDMSMKRIKLHPKRRQVHWWNSEVEDARRTCIQK